MQCSKLQNRKVVRQAEKNWLNLEIQHHYSSLDKMELKLYNLHLSMTKGIDDIQFREFNQFHFASISRGDAVFKEKRKTQNKKLKNC